MNDVEAYKDTKETYGEGTLEIGTNKDKVDTLIPATPTKRMIALKKTIKFTGEGKLSTPLSKGIKNSSPVYFKSRSNKKPITKKEIYKNMVFKTYVKLTLPITMQQATEFGTAEQAILEAFLLQ